MKIWYHFFECHVPNADQIVDRLTQLGLTLFNFDADQSLGMGIIFFDKFSPELHDFIAEQSRNGLARMLAIPLSHAILSRDQVWQLLQSGASDVFTLDLAQDALEKIAARFERWHSVDEVMESPVVRDNLIGTSHVWRTALRQIVEVACFTSSSVLIAGESGSGKELVARLIHTVDRRPDKGELIILDCTTIVPELSGSEFFGHERGAFTGAFASRDGAFALANGGTLFLDEVGELPLKLQAQLLRVVQERTYKRIGGNTWHSTDFRLICATNRNLFQEVKNGNFRSDLYYRMANWTCTLPPLRERSEDVILLARHFIKHAASGGDSPDIDRPVREYLLRREYPGNVRDLKQLVFRIINRHVGKGPVTVGDIPEEERPKGNIEPMNWCDGHFEAAIRKALLIDVGIREIRRVAEHTAINLAVNEENGSLPRAAKKLGISDRALQMKWKSKRESMAYLNKEGLECER